MGGEKSIPYKGHQSTQGVKFWLFENTCQAINPVTLHFYFHGDSAMLRYEKAYNTKRLSLLIRNNKTSFEVFEFHGMYVIN